MEEIVGDAVVQRSWSSSTPRIAMSCGTDSRTCIKCFDIVVPRMCLAFSSSVRFEQLSRLQKLSRLKLFAYSFSIRASARDRIGSSTADASVDSRVVTTGVTGFTIRSHGSPRISLCSSSAAIMPVPCPLSEMLSEMEEIVGDAVVQRSWSSSTPRIAMSCGTDSRASSAHDRICCARRSWTTNTPVGCGRVASQPQSRFDSLA